MILGWVLALVLLVAMPVSADVGDNLNGWLINFLGYGKESNVPSNYEGSLVERINFLEKQQEDLRANVATKDQVNDLAIKTDSLVAKTDGLVTKTNNLATKEDVENISKAANASYNLYVYIPKDIATGNYDGQKVTITSSSGNQNSTATLRDDGVNYSATLYFNFVGNCRLNFNVLCNTTAFGVTLPVTISATGQEQKLWEKGKFSEQYSWDFIHEICSNNKANQFFNAGNKLGNGWTVVNTESNGIKTWYNGWSFQNIMCSWNGAYAMAGSYFVEWNSENTGLPITAYKSELLSYAEALTMTCDDRKLGYLTYWTSTLTGINETVYYVACGNGFFDSCDRDDGLSHCCPAVWIH